jgi:hypothetical protein
MQTDMPGGVRQLVPRAGFVVQDYFEDKAVAAGLPQQGALDGFIDGKFRQHVDHAHIEKRVPDRQ